MTACPNTCPIQQAELFFTIRLQGSAYRLSEAFLPLSPASASMKHTGMPAPQLCQSRD